MASASEPVPKPAGGPFGEYVRENRLDIAKEMGDQLKGKGAVLKKASEIWKTMSKEARAPYVTRFKEHTVAFQAYAASDAFVPTTKKVQKRKRDYAAFLALNGVVAPSVEDGSTAAGDGDTGAQRVAKPAGGPFGEYVRENRLDIAKEMGDSAKGKGAVLKKAGELWKTMSEEAREPYVQQFAEHQGAYAAYKASDSFVAKGPNTKKLKREFDSYQSFLKTNAKGTAGKAGTAAKGVMVLDAEVLRDAASDGMGALFEKFCSRPKVVAHAAARGVGQRDLLMILKKHQGKVCKAQAELLAHGGRFLAKESDASQ